MIAAAKELLLSLEATRNETTCYEKEGNGNAQDHVSFWLNAGSARIHAQSEKLHIVACTLFM